MLPGYKLRFKWVLRNISVRDVRLYVKFPFACFGKCVVLAFGNVIFRRSVRPSFKTVKHSNGICLKLKTFTCVAIFRRGNLFIYSQLSLSRLRLSRITAYLEEKIWSLL